MRIKQVVRISEGQIIRAILYMYVGLEKPEDIFCAHKENEMAMLHDW